jgi:hypothetical protein
MRRCARVISVRGVRGVDARTCAGEESVDVSTERSPRKATLAVDRRRQERDERWLDWCCEVCVLWYTTRS